MSFQKKLRSGEFVILAEMEPPKGVDASSMLANAMQVKGKVDAFVVPEMSNAVMKMSSLGGCMLLQSKGLEAVLQVCCRDRNRLALQADLLAACALGTGTVMAVAGEDPALGDHRRARAVYDLELLELIEGIKKLETGRDMAGIELRGAPTFCVGSNVNAGASGGALDLEIQEMQKRAAAGAEFFVTTPIFDMEGFAKFLKRLPDPKLKVIPTVLLLKSVGMARYINQNVPAIQIPNELIGRIQKAPEKVRECTKIAAELVAAAKNLGCCGVNVSTIGWEDKLPSILEV